MIQSCSSTPDTEAGTLLPCLQPDNEQLQEDCHLQKNNFKKCIQQTNARQVFAQVFTL